jgi:hypothetical protein
MDYLLTIEPQLAEEAYRRVTDLLNLEVDLLFFDTTSTYFETGEADEPVSRDKDGRRVGSPARLARRFDPRVWPRSHRMPVPLRPRSGCCDLRFDRKGWLRQDRGSCPFACST